MTGIDWEVIHRQQKQALEEAKLKQAKLRKRQLELGMLYPNLESYDKYLRDLAKVGAITAADYFTMSNQVSTKGDTMAYGTSTSITGLGYYAYAYPSGTSTPTPQQMRWFTTQVTTEQMKQLYPSPTTTKRRKLLLLPSP